MDYFTGILSTRLIPATYAMAVVVGIPSNALILGTLIVKAKTFSTAVLYLSLAVSDLLVMFTLTFKIHYHFSGNNWVFGEAFCQVVTACFYGNLYCSIHMHMCISIKRYLAIVHPFRYKSLPKHTCTIWSTLAVWAVFLVAMVPEVLIRQSYFLPQLGITTCHDVLPKAEEYYTLLLYYKMGITCLGFFIPFIVTVISYVSIIYHLNKSHHDWIYYIKMSTLVFIIFTVCFTPSNVLYFVHSMKLYTSREEYFYIYYNVALCLCSLHCCLDPFLFFLMSRTTGSKLSYITFKGKAMSFSI
ncbi:proteinase-activated receptor 3-like [Scleropages formosus]|nr:proteinase-activated receptor 3-like [Scleropages formosus]